MYKRGGGETVSTASLVPLRRAVWLVTRYESSPSTSLESRSSLDEEDLDSRPVLSHHPVHEPRVELLFSTVPTSTTSTLHSVLSHHYATPYRRVEYEY